ncbi:hypothetical protein [Nostoc sp. FACHB-888]|uniref:hypothetical protein n=1 Tax=Nostoc sp. FACHB-888 TaxID=2692842 RepID=UPI001685732E|nr:hypothetical protein [Nostoc sp. FACHB-888]MBD2245121.1 hypothetical protein [Nostoc sp. FACHB-888]
MTKAKTTQETSKVASLDPRLTQIIQLYTVGQQEYDGIKDYPELELKDFENEVQLLIYKQGFEDAVYDQSFKPELDNPEFLNHPGGTVFQGWVLKGKEYSEDGSWIIRWTNGNGIIGRTLIAPNG